MLEEGTITSVTDNMQLAHAMCHLMQSPRVKGLKAADLFYGCKVRSPLLPSLIDIGQCRITDQQWAEVCKFKEDNRAKSMLQGPKGRKSHVQMAFKNDYILETDNTAELKVDDSCLVYDTAHAMWTRDAVVSEVRPSGRSYWVQEISRKTAPLLPPPPTEKGSRWRSTLGGAGQEGSVELGQEQSRPHLPGQHILARSNQCTHTSGLSNHPHPRPT